MDRKRTRHTKRISHKRIARVGRLALALVMAFSLATLAVLVFRIGEVLWPVWLIDYRRSLIAILSVMVIFLTLAAPVIIGFMDDPRPLSGPGKNPETGV